MSALSNLSPAGIMMILNNMGFLTQREEDLHSGMLDMVGVVNGKNEATECPVIRTVFLCLVLGSFR